MIKGIIFDLDGTLLNTLDDLTQGINYALKNVGLKTKTKEEVKNFVGNGIEKSIERALEGNLKYKNKCLELFLEYYKNNSLKNTKPYNNVVETLEKLKNKGCKLAVLSNKMDDEVKKLSDYFFKGIFDISKGANPKKPDPATTLEIIEQFNLKSSEVVFAGDSEVDIQTAKNAGIKCLSVCYGFKTKEFLKSQGAEYLFDDFSELWDYFILESVCT